MFLLRFFTTATILSLLFYYVNRSIQSPLSNTIFLWLASTSVLAIGFISWRLQPSRYGGYILLALLFCWLGDLVGPSIFLFGGISFLIAHIFYFLSFTQLGISDSLLMRFIALAVFSLLFSIFLSHTGQVNIIQIVAYLTALSLMVAGAFSLRPGSPRNLVRLAAILFFISDIALLSWNAGLANLYWLCYPLYYLSCILFAWSPLFVFPTVDNTTE